MAAAAENVTPLRKTGIQPGDSIEFRRAKLCTDASAARVFKEKFGSYVKWNPSWGWLTWTGQKWQRDEGEFTRQAALEVAGHFREKATEFHANKEPDKLVGWVLAFARRCESAKGIEDFLTVARPVLYESADAFDTHPWLVNFRNCVLDFDRIEGKTVKVLEHSPAFNLTKSIDHDYSFGAPCPKWDAFLEDILPDRAVREFVQRAVGYSLTGSTREQVFFLLWGGGCNGKSVFLNTILNVIGRDYAMQADARTFMATRDDRIRNDVADLRGIRFLSAIETGESKRLDEGLIKQLTGNDFVRARHLYHEAFQFKPEFKLWLATNHRPVIRGTDWAIWRRIRLIPFTQTIPEDKQDRDLESKLLREVEGILNWCIEGAISYHIEGLQAPTEVVQATAEYRSAEDVVGQFLDECTIAEGNAQVAKGELYKVYREWCDGQKEYSLTKTKFGTYIGERGFDEYRDGRARYWIGIGLQSGQG